ncbi:MAG: zinc-ribbon domain-containing protein, partial [Nitrososphaerales archaeon]
MPFCEYCGHNLDADASFCPGCGKPVKKAAPPTIQPPPLLQAQATTPQQPETHREVPDFNIESVLLPGEQVAWHIDIEEGVIHR